MLDFAVARSFVFRLTIVFGAIMTISIAFLLALLYTVTVGALSQQLDRDIGAEFDSLASEASMGGPESIAAEVAERTVALSRTQFVYALFDKGGHRVAGSTLHAPPKNGWTILDISPDSHGTPGDAIRLRTARLVNGMTLVVGGANDRVQALRRFFLTTLPASIGVALLLAFGAAMMMSLRFWHRIERVTNVCREIMSGKLTIRAPVGSAGDEVDEIATSMNAMLDRIDTLMQTMRQVTNDVAHDLRTPLARLRQGLERATLCAQTTLDYETAVRAAIQEADGLLDTFSALLAIAETEAGAARAAFVAVDLAQIVESVAEAYDADAEARGQRIEVSVEPDIVVNGNANLLTQMTANLVENALRHCPPGTDISLSTTKRDGRPVLIVTDNGPGIPEEDRARVLGRFVRLERSRTTPGSGLGLSLAAAVAELHGATLYLNDNRPGLRCELKF